MSAKPLLRSSSLYITALSCLLLAFAAAPAHASKYNDWKYEETHTDARDFAAGGFVHVRMNVGDVHIKRGDANKINLRYTVKSRHEQSVKDATVTFDVHGTDANLEFHASSTNTEFDVELEVPQTTNLDVHQKVGDMIIQDVEGDKDLTLGVGDIRLQDRRSGYRRVNASSGIGDVNANGYGETSGWLGKTLKYHGEGKYELRAHVGVGDITLEGK